MRLIVIVFLLLALILEGVAFLGFTGPGNDMLLPYVNAYLKSKVPQAKVEVIKMRLKPNKVAFIAKINDQVNVRAKGDMGILNQNFDINYTVRANEIKAANIVIKENIHISGNAKGTPDDMQTAGSGKALKSRIHYKLSLVDKNPRNISISIKNANLRSLLILGKQKPYATGLVSLHLNMPDFTPLAPNINGVFSIKNGVLSKKEIAEDFNISLAEDTPYKTNFFIKTKKKKITFMGTIDSSLANLAIKNGKYTLLSNSAQADFRLNVPKLEKLSSIAGLPLRGDFLANGKFAFKDDTPSLIGKTKSFGGRTIFDYYKNKFILTITKIDNALLLHKMGQPKYLNGTTSGKIKLNNIKKLTGIFDINTKGDANTLAIKKDFDLDIGEKFHVDSSANGKIKNYIIKANLKTKTTMANLKADSIRYDITKSKLTTNYQLDIPDMGKLKTLTGKVFKGDMQINGKIKKAKYLVATGIGKEFGGDINFKLLDEKFHADVTGVTVSKVMTMLDYPQVLEALSKAKVDYNTKTSSGTLHATLDNAKILPNKLTALLKRFNVIDLTKERFNNSKFDAKISKTLIDFSLDARNKNNYFVINNGKLTKKSGAINAKVDMKIKGKDLQATIRGTLNHPIVSFDGSKFIENKIKDKVKKKFGKKIDKAKQKIKKKLGNKLGNAVKGLF